MLANSEDESFDYDAAGNQSRDTHSYGSAGEVTRSYNDVLNKLRVYDRPSRTINPLVTASWDYDEYFYDALGRRVMTRSQVFCWNQDPNDGRCFSKIRRTIWDGSEELWEIQSPGDGSAGLESDFSSSKFSRLWGACSM